MNFLWLWLKYNFQVLKNNPRSIQTPEFKFHLKQFVQLLVFNFGILLVVSQIGYDHSEHIGITIYEYFSVNGFEFVPAWKHGLEGAIFDATKERFSNYKALGDPTHIELHYLIVFATDVSDHLDFGFPCDFVIQELRFC